MQQPQTFTLAVAMLCSLLTLAVADVRIKDITDVDGLQRHTLNGIGLVAGLNGSGGTHSKTREMASNLLERFQLRNDPGLRDLIKDDTKFKTNDLAMVFVTGEMRADSARGSTFDVSVAAVDDSADLSGGLLITTPLYAIDNRVYATAQGQISTTGFSFGGEAASVQKNHLTSARVSNGGKVQVAICEDPNHMRRQSFRFLLRNPDYVTASRISEAINAIHPYSATAINAGQVLIHVPPEYQANNLELIAKIGALRVKPDTEARVVINEKTGTIMIGANVRISAVAFTHGNLTVATGETPEVSQPSPLSGGQTVVVPRTEVNVTEETRRVQLLEETTSVGDLVAALNSLGVTPRDLSAIFQHLKNINALHAALEFN